MLVKKSDTVSCAPFLSKGFCKPLLSVAPAFARDVRFDTTQRFVESYFEKLAS